MNLLASSFMFLALILGLVTGSATPPEGCPKCECPTVADAESQDLPLEGRSLGDVPTEYVEGPAYGSTQMAPEFMRMNELSMFMKMLLAGPDAEGVDRQVKHLNSTEEILKES